MNREEHVTAALLAWSRNHADRRNQAQAAIAAVDEWDLAHDKAERVAQPMAVTAEMVAVAFARWRTRNRETDSLLIREMLEAALRAAPAEPHPYTTNRGYGAEGAERAKAGRQRELDAEVARRSDSVVRGMYYSVDIKDAFRAIAAAFRHRAGEAEGSDG